MTTTTLDSLPTTSSPRRILRSTGAVLAGLIAIAAASTGTDALMRATGVFPYSATAISDTLLLLALAYRTIFGIAGTYLTARLAPSRPAQHAYILGAIGTVLATLGAIAMWHVGGHWYAIANIVIALPTAFVGSQLALENTLQR
jgi:hypothetical protein